MSYEVENEQTEPVTPPPLAPDDDTGLPRDFVFTERAAAALRAYLREAGLEGYRIFHAADLDLHDIDKHLEALGERGRFEPFPPLTPRGEAVEKLAHGRTTATLRRGGVLRLRTHAVVIVRWFWAGGKYESGTLWLCAAPSAAAYNGLRQELNRLRRQRGSGAWQIVRGFQSSDGPRIPRDALRRNLVLSDDVRGRVEREMIGFFADVVRALYAGVGVPYRRGVLLHGPPGNGKTSLVRYVGAALPHVPALVLRPSDGFESSDLEEVLNRWTRLAPALLVIEDLNWLLKRVDVSLFLNMIDGIESPASGGLLLIATTNHPEELDPAINNRPGRFDVVIEIGPPDQTLRARFLDERLADMPDTVRAKLAAETGGLSFAHLEEILRLSGLLAIHDGRGARAETDLIRAADAVRAGHEDARRGFPSRPEVPFGLLRAARAETELGLGRIRVAGEVARRGKRADAASKLAGYTKRAVALVRRPCNRCGA